MHGCTRSTSIFLRTHQDRWMQKAKETKTNDAGSTAELAMHGCAVRARPLAPLTLRLVNGIGIPPSLRPHIDTDCQRAIN
jgi:hypothetical protein